MLRKIPGTFILIFSSIIIAALSRTLWISAEQTGLLQIYGYGLPAFSEGHWWTIITGLFIPPKPWMLIIIIVTLFVGCGLLEYFYGTIKMLIVVFATHILAVLLTTLTLIIFKSFDINWAIQLAKINDVGISNAAFGAMGAASAALPYVWRGRFRFIIILYCVTMILYSGVIWDISHLFGFLVGMALGPWVAGRPYSTNEYPILKTQPRILVAGLVGLGAYSALVTRIFPGNGGILNFDNTTLEHSSLLVLTLTTIFMSIFIYGLSRGKKAAWIFILILSFLSFVSVMLIGSGASKWFDLLYYSLLIFLLIYFRNYFKVKSDKFTRNKLLIWALVGAIGVMLIHSFVVYIFRSSLVPSPNIGQIFMESLLQSVGLTTNQFRSNIPLINNFIDSIYIFWVIYLLVLLSAIMLSTLRLREEHNLEVFDKLQKYSKANSIGWMARWEGISYWVSKSSKAAFAFRLINNVAIVFSDPVGTNQAINASIEDFHKYCKQQGWIIAYFSVSKPMSEKLNKRGFSGIVIGEDTIIELEDLEFTGKDWQSVRSALNKANKQGIQMQSSTLNSLSPDIKKQLYDIAKSWVQDKSLPEMGFTLGTLKQAEDPEILMNIAVDENGIVHGMTSWMPVYENGQIVGRTLDIMQRSLREGTVHGIMEFLIASSAIKFKQDGLRYISLSAAPLSNSSTNKTMLDNLLEHFSDVMEPLYGFKSLHRFKEKFKPIHEQLYLCYDEPTALPQITLAISRAYMNDQSYLSILTNMAKKGR